MNLQAERSWIGPRANRLLLAVCLVLVLLVGLPSLFSIKLMVLVSPVLLGACFMLFSVQRTLLVLLLILRRHVEPVALAAVPPTRATTAPVSIATTMVVTAIRVALTATSLLLMRAPAA